MLTEKLSLPDSGSVAKLCVSSHWRSDLQTKSMTPHAFGVRSIRVASCISLKMLTRDAISRQNLRVASEPSRECRLSPGLPADTDVAVRAHGLAPDRYMAYRFGSSPILSTCPAEYCGAGRLDQWGVSGPLDPGCLITGICVACPQDQSRPKIRRG